MIKPKPFQAVMSLIICLEWVYVIYLIMFFKDCFTGTGTIDMGEEVCV